MNETTDTGEAQRGTPDLLRRAAAAEWGRLYGTVREQLVRRRLGAVPLALTATGLVLLFDVVQHLPGGAALVERLGVVRASLPLDRELLRTPLSLFVPALDLPVWGALAQVLLVFGIAEMVLGRRRTLLIAYTGTLAGTLYARVAVALGPGHLLGLPGKDALVRDCGPSAAVVALAICVAWQSRAWFTAAAVALLMAGEAVVLPNLAGLEHVSAIGAALLLALSAEVLSTHRPHMLTLVTAAAADSRRPAAGAVAR